MTDEEIKLKAFIELCVGGTVTLLNRQPRWRKAWYATVERDNKTIPLYIRGDKQLDAEPFPGLNREARILQILEDKGLPVPHIYGFCEDPEVIVMDKVPGERDVSLAANDKERHKIACDYIAIMAKMHSLDIQPFIEMGIELPSTPEKTALAYINANQPLYDRTKRGTDPLVEFGLLWLRRNAPKNRTQVSFIQADAGQYLFDKGQLTCIYDFEASHIGDPISDLASLRVREPTEPFGTDLNAMMEHYQQVTGEKIDPWVLSYHTAAFMMTAVMSLVGPLKDPTAELHAEYLIWDLTCRRAFLWALAECLDITVQRCTSPPQKHSRQQRTLAVLKQTIERLESGNDTDSVNKNAALMLTQWLQKSESLGPHFADKEIALASDILGYQPTDFDEIDTAMEKHVLNAAPEQDTKLFEYFAWQIESQCLIAESLGDRLEGYALKPIKL